SMPCWCATATSPTSSGTSRSTSESVNLTRLDRVGFGVFAATMAAVRGLLTISLLLGLCVLLAAGCGEAKKAAAAPVAAPKPHCAYRAGWQRLANKVKAPVYCPGWLPDPLTSQIGGKWSNGDDVSPDRSYLESFVWQET